MHRPTARKRKMLIWQQAIQEQMVQTHQSRARQKLTAHRRVTIVPIHEPVQRTIICQKAEKTQHIEKAADMEGSHGISSI